MGYVEIYRFRVYGRSGFAKVRHIKSVMSNQRPKGIDMKWKRELRSGLFGFGFPKSRGPFLMGSQKEDLKKDESIVLDPPPTLY